MKRGHCAVCGGWGWREATDDEITEQLRLDADPGTATRRRAMWRNSAVPCEICEPHQHKLWKDGHMQPGHSCEACRPARITSRKRRR